MSLGGRCLGEGESRVGGLSLGDVVEQVDPAHDPDDHLPQLARLHTADCKFPAMESSPKQAPN